MTKPINEKQPLFRSLAADKSKSQTRSRTAAREAEERWPLFKAVAPALPSALPALGDDDKRHWHRDGKAGADPRPPSLSVPDMSARLALGLSRMGARRQLAPAMSEAATMVPAPAPSPAPAPTAAETASPQTTLPALAAHEPPPPAGGPSLFARRTAAVPPEPAARPAPAAGLAAHMAAGAPAQPEAAPADRSLAAIFNRLAPKEAPEPPAPPRASFLSRLGRR